MSFLKYYINSHVMLKLSYVKVYIALLFWYKLAYFCCHTVRLARNITKRFLERVDHKQPVFSQLTVELMAIM